MKKAFAPLLLLVVFLSGCETVSWDFEGRLVSFKDLDITQNERLVTLGIGTQDAGLLVEGREMIFKIVTKQGDEVQVVLETKDAIFKENGELILLKGKDIEQIFDIEGAIVKESETTWVKSYEENCRVESRQGKQEVTEWKEVTTVNIVLDLLSVDTKDKVADYSGSYQYEDNKILRSTCL